jgi:hypothetical protein
MRKTLSVLALVAASTIAVLAGSGSANAYTANADGSTSVTKGEVQKALGWNNAEFDANVKPGVPVPTFTGLVQMDSTDVWSCSDGSTESRTSRVIQSQAFNVKQVLNGNGKQVTGWTLNGTVGYGSYVSGTRLGAPYVGYCANGGFTGFLPHVFENTVLPGVSVNGVALAVTPVV